MNAASEILPWSVEAEQAVLGGYMLDPRAFDRAGPMEAEHFFDAAHRVIFQACAGISAASKPLDVITVHEQLCTAGKSEEAGGLLYLNAIAQSIPSATNIHRYAEIVREKAAQRALIEAADSALSIAKECASVSDKLERITSLFIGLTRTSIRKVPKHIAEVALRRVEHYQAVEEGLAEPGWPTGLPSMDSMLTGGLQPGRLYILAARPSIGKSSFSEHLMLSLARAGRTALFLSQEMPEEELADRAISNRGRVSYRSMLTGKMGHEDWSRLCEAAEDLTRLPIYVDDQPALTLTDVRAKARTVNGLKVLVLDYLQLCSGSKDADNRNAQIEAISRGLKALAKEMGIAVIALSQLNRNVEQRPNKRPILADLRDSGAIEQDADVVMFLWPLRDLGESRLVGIGIDKNRQGRCGEACLHFNGDIQYWAESTEPMYLEQPQSRSRGFQG